MRTEATIRFGSATDVAGICELEKRVWSRRGVAPLDETTVLTWIDTHREGFLIGEHDGCIRGYVYFEHLSYDPCELNANWPPAHAAITVRHHERLGTALYGISAAADLPGLGVQLFRRILELGGVRGKTHLATLIRMQGLARFLDELRHQHIGAKKYSDEQLALWYAMHCVGSAGGEIARHLAETTLPAFFPQHIRKDPVLTYPTHVARMTLHGIIPGSFNDPESRNLLALATFPTL